MKKEVIAITFFLVLVSLSYTVSAPDWGIITKISPSITLDFTDESDTVSIDSFDLKNSTSDLIDYFKESVEVVSWNVFLFKPKPGERLKDNEEYTFTVTYYDDADPPNYETSIYTFTIQYPLLNITLIEPTLGVSPIKPFDFRITTDRTADCKHSFLDNPYEDMASSFTTSDNLLHEELDFETTGTVYVKCKDEYDKITSESFDLSFDDSPPDIIYKHADDATEYPIETTLTVRTNEDTVCKYYMEDSEVDYEDMTPFLGYDESDEDSYNTEHQQILDETDLIDNQVNRIYIRCKNKAELLSAMEYLDINVDTTIDPLITINSPKEYITDTTPLFNVTTNKDSTCRIADNPDMDNVINMGGTKKDHIKELTTALSIGTYTYYVECIFAVEGAIKTSVTFTIDNTKPSMLYVDIIDYNGTGKTYNDDELCAEWKGEDNESHIVSYAYSVFWDKSSDVLIKEGTRGPESGNEYCIDVELNNSQEYYITVSAKNGVGLWSDSKTSSSIQVDTSLRSGCANDHKDDDETDVDCGGVCEGCANGMDCLLDSDCENKFCNSSNKCASPTCDDGERNGRETDVDCGGNCDKCDIGKFCNKDEDCKTNYCDASTGKCAAILDDCENNKLDTGETDVDCGGVCPACGIGKNCDLDSDCMDTAKCEDGVCALDSDGDGIVDDEDNCPDIANEDQEDIDSDDIGDACDSDSDNDGLPDSFEEQYFDCVTCANPDDDPDKDGLTNLDEYTYNTNPTKRDTDGDGYTDKEEIDKGTDPNDPGSHPGGGFLKYFLMILGLAVLGGGGYFGYKLLKQKKRPFVPPRAQLRRPPIRPPMRRRVMPPGKRIRPPLAKPPLKPIIKKSIIQKQKISPVKQIEKKKEKGIFDKLSQISKAERLDQVENKMKSLKLSDKELKDRIGKLKKELKVK